MRILLFIFLSSCFADFGKEVNALFELHKSKWIVFSDSVRQESFVLNIALTIMISDNTNKLEASSLYSVLHESKDLLQDYLDETKLSQEFKTYLECFKGCNEPPASIYKLRLIALLDHDLHDVLPQEFSHELKELMSIPKQINGDDEFQLVNDALKSVYEFLKLKEGFDFDYLNLENWKTHEDLLLNEVIIRVKKLVVLIHNSFIKGIKSKNKDFLNFDRYKKTYEYFFQIQKISKQTFSNLQETGLILK